MKRFNFGDYVAYCPEYKKKPDIGRFISYGRIDGTSFVCFHDGCTAAQTNTSLLRKATEEEIEQASTHIGFHRFDALCPTVDLEICNCHCVSAMAAYERERENDLWL